MKTKHLNKESPLISVEDFSFDYDSQKNPTIKNMNLRIERNETVLLMGPSGSGKSTLALCLNGLYPDAVEGWKKGSIYYKGENIESFEKGVLNKRIGVVFQDPESQFCMVTVENELAFTMENIQVPREEMKPRIEKIVRQVGIESLLKRPIHELSGGQKQKVALASVLLLEPELIILDEPTANLDPYSRKGFIDLIGQLKVNHHLAVLIIEHQLDDWLSFTDRVICLSHQGEKIAEGEPGSIFYKNADLLLKEGVHLPKVVETYLKHGQPFAFDENYCPLSERELALFFAEKNKGFNLYVSPSKPTIKESSPILSLKDVSYSRKKKQQVLRDIDIDFHEGEFIGIVGENGAGKSTLLQILAGILTPTTGSRSLLGKDFKKWSEHELRKNLGFVFQNPEHQFITDTVYDELAFGMKLNRDKEHDIREKVTHLLSRFRLEGKMWSNPFALSGGQKRRLSVATMLDETPKILLFDEPTFGQDAKTTEELMIMINSLREQGTTIVFVTHDMELVDRYCERVIVLHKGEVSFQGAQNKLWENDDLIAKAHLRLPYRIRLKNELNNVKREARSKGVDREHVRIH
ncbi:ATP-binding cassette domain-containing protein [Bacillus shivajii]|uniref:ABC transporter ATP-binding protein n=1 Tax=Bacillus shivajii TaxID=1983719 RepID=UPI001CFB4DB5|nr:ABC transporter ATP-binding protein [Bacillus shivajii]UCZ52220.1 ATP-binding cassette domain-containing protein [Bacillus shivajii]